MRILQKDMRARRLRAARHRLRQHRLSSAWWAEEPQTKAVRARLQVVVGLLSVQVLLLKI